VSREDDIQQLIINHQRRLQKLREQQALQGLSVDPKILIEIEDIEKEIEKLEIELTNVATKTQVEITVQSIKQYRYLPPILVAAAIILIITLIIAKHDFKGEQKQTSSAVEEEKQSSSITQCEILPKQRFGEAWELHQSELGCPVGDAQLVNIAEQPFERGHMFWHSEKLLIYVAYDEDGIWEAFPDDWVNTPSPIPTVRIPNPDLMSPIKGFGKVWYEKLRGANSRIGFATYPEQLFQDWFWEYEHGFMMKDSDQTIYIFIEDGTFSIYE
jgi:hypothetical protein